jgi:hypothetical protein
MLMHSGMKLFLMPSAPSWWIWTVTAGLLALGIADTPGAFVAAIAISAAQTVFFAFRERDLKAYPLQIRVAYTTLLVVAFIPLLRWLYWVPMVGTFALVLFGYCLTARLLSLAPWNRRESVTFDLLCRTFLTPPVAGNIRHGLPATGCPGGVCALEARAAEFARSTPLRPTLGR